MENAAATEAAEASVPAPAGLFEMLLPALAKARSLGELFDALLESLGQYFAPATHAAIYLAEAGRLQLEAQIGHESVVHSLAPGAAAHNRAVEVGEALLDHGGGQAGEQALLPFRLDTLAGLLIVELAPGTSSEAALTELDGAVRALHLAHSKLSTRAQERSPLTRLSRTFVRIAAQRDVGQLLELSCRTIGELTGLETVQALTGDRGLLQARALWRRTADAPHGLAPSVALQLASRSGFVPTLFTRTEPLPRELIAAGLECAVLLPLAAGGEVLGIVAGVTRQAARLAGDALEQAELVTTHAATALGNLRRYEEVVAASLTDGLTGLANHRRFHEDGAALIEACRSADGRFALVIADLDDFKDLNDRRGHVAGDDVLRMTATLLTRGLRPDDRAYRLGGEEFGLLLPATTKSNARTVCRRMQRSLAQVDLDGWKLSQSMGIASFPEDGETVRDLYAAADAALYEAKRLGKDRITLADERLVARRTQGESMAARGRRSFEQMRHLQSLASALAGTRTPSDVGQAIVRELESAIPHDACGAFLLAADGTLVVAASRGAAGDELSVHARRAVDEGRSFLVDDAREEHPSSALAGIACSPLFAEEHVVGAILVAARQWSRYDRDDQRLLEVIGHLGGLAAENLRLVDERSLAAEAAFALAGRLAACRSLDETIAAATSIIAEYMPVADARIRLFEDEAERAAAGGLAATEIARDASGGVRLLICARAHGEPQGVIDVSWAIPLADGHRRLLEGLAPSLALALAAHRGDAASGAPRL